jgi:hypothetical protein
VRLEEPAVEERNGTECRRDSPSPRPRAVERAEEERAEQVAVQPAATAQARVYRIGDEPISARQPSLGLNEIEEEHTSELEQRVGPPILGPRGAGKPLGHALEGAAELPIEAPARRFTGEGFCGPGGIRQGTLAGPGEPAHAAKRDRVRSGEVERDR